MKDDAQEGAEENERTIIAETPYGEVVTMRVTSLPMYWSEELQRFVTVPE